jgi:NTE family protein
MYEPATPRLVLALSGGGTRGGAHIGVLQGLEKLGMRTDGIAASSVGALIGSLYAGGMSPKEIAARLKRVDWNSLLLDEPERRSLLLARKAEHSRHMLTLRLGQNFTPVVPGAVTPGQKLYRQLLKQTLDLPYRTTGSWSDFTVPLKIVATDLIGGDRVVFDRGDPAIAIRASMSMPLLFEPLALGQLQLVDGGVASNIPVEIARSTHEDDSCVVLAVDVTSDLRQHAGNWQPWEIVDQVTTILEASTNARSLSTASLVVSPVISDSLAAVDSPFDAIVAAGRLSVLTIADTLKSLLNAPPEADDTDTLFVVHLSESSDIPHELLAPDSWRIGRRVPVGELRAHLRRLYSSGIVRVASIGYDESSYTLNIEIELTPVVRTVSLTGDNTLPDTIRDKFQSRLAGQRFNRWTFQAALLELMRQYRIAGYPAAIAQAIEFDDTTGRLNLAFDLGRVASIEFEGSERVSTLWLEHEIPLTPGVPLTRSGILDGMENLYATGLFRNVYPAIEPDTISNGWRLIYHIVEHPSPMVRLGVAYLDEQRARGFVEVTYPSPFNYAARSVVFGSVGERDQNHKLDLIVDKIVGNPVTVSLSLGINTRNRSFFDKTHRDTDSYDEARWGGKFRIGGQARGWGMLSLTGRWEWHDNLYPDRDESYRLFALGAELGLDTEDRSPYPNRGVRATAAVETAPEPLGSERDFTRFWGNWEAFITPIRRHTVGVRFQGGSTSGAVPRDERLRLGGIHSFPGLHLDELVSSRQIATGLEYRFDMLSRVLADSYIGLRWDAGSTWDDPTLEIDKLDWHNSVAAYFALDTVLGPIHLQWSRLFGAGGLTNHTIYSLQAGSYF